MKDIALMSVFVPLLRREVVAAESSARIVGDFVAKHDYAVVPRERKVRVDEV